MKIHSVVRKYWDACQVHEVALIYFASQELAEYVSLELEKEFGRKDRIWFEVDSHEVNTNDLDRQSVLMALNVIKERSRSGEFYLD